MNGTSLLQAVSFLLQQFVHIALFFHIAVLLAGIFCLCFFILWIVKEIRLQLQFFIS